MKKLATILALAAYTLLASASVNAQAFGNGNIVVYRVGDGTQTLINTGNTVFLDEYDRTTGVLISSVQLPNVATTTGNRALIASGTATTEGQLTRSTNGRFLVLTGYNSSIPAGANLTTSTSATNNRVIGRVDSNKTIDTTTSLTDAFSGGSIRSATSDDGTSFYAVGANDGVRFATLGATTSTVVSSTQTNLRVVRIFNNQLYVSSGAAGNNGVNTVGTGVSNSPGQMTTLLVADPATTSTNASGATVTTNGSPFGFVFTDSNTLYFADDRALNQVNGTGNTGGGGGLYKFTSTDGVNFTQAFRITSGLTAGLRGLTASVTNGTVTLYATTAESPTRLVTLVDNGAGSAFTPLATAGTNTAFRGVAFAPINTTAATVMIEGRVTTPDGTPLSGVTLRLSGSQQAVALSDDDGSYRFESVEVGGIYTVSASYRGYRFASSRYTFGDVQTNTVADFTASPIKGRSSRSRSSRF